MDLEPTLALLIYSTLAAATAAVGVLPHALRREPSLAEIGWANAVAAGLMLGVAYALLTAGLKEGLAAGGLGALLGVVFVRGTHALAGTAELDLEELDGSGPEVAYRALLSDIVHGAHEGVAIGAAMVLSIPLGIAMAVTLGVHNVPEAVILTRVLVRRGASLPRATALAMTSNVNQPLLAVATFAILGAAPVLVPWVTGFAVGAVTYLVLVELLPEAYQQAGHTTIAVVTALAMAVVVLLAGIA